MELLQAVEAATFILTLLMMLAVIPLTNHMFKSKTTDGMPFWTFLFSFVNGYVSRLYGEIINNNVVWTLNTLGVILYGVAILVFLSVTKQRVKTFVKLSMAASVLSYLHVHTVSLDESLQKDFLGPISLVLTMVMLSSPLLDVGHFIQQKSCQGMAVPMITLNFLSCVLWTLYGEMLQDSYISLPNIPGFISTGVYFALMLYYGFPDVKQKQT